MQISDRFSKPSQLPRVLIIQLGDIGDVVWSLSALQAVRETYLGLAISILLREGNGLLLAVEALPPKVQGVGSSEMGADHRLAVGGVRDCRRHSRRPRREGTRR